MAEQHVTLNGLANGSLHELFDREMERVTRDILDLNSEAEVVRKIKIEVIIKPDKDRNFGQAGVFVSSSLGRPKPVGTTIFFGRKNGKPIAVENVAEQSELFDKLGPRPAVVNFNDKTGEIEE